MQIVHFLLQVMCFWGVASEKEKVGRVFRIPGDKEDGEAAEDKESNRRSSFHFSGPDVDAVLLDPCDA